MKKAKWIWASNDAKPDEYVRFYDSFDFNGGEAKLYISVDSNYQLFINGNLAAFGQYSDFPYDKVYDTVDVTRFCEKGENELEILVWYYGFGSQTYQIGKAGLIYEITDDGEVVSYSSENTLCALAKDYVHGKCKRISPQLGISYTYDARGAEAPVNPKNAVLVDIPSELRPRPNKKITIGDFIPASYIGKKKKIYDLGRETVGYLGFTFKAPEGALVTVSYGEYIAFPGDGKAEFDFACGDGELEVRRRIHIRDFSLEFYGNGKTVRFSNFMRRLGLRYLQVECDQDVEVEDIGVYPAEYPLIVKDYKAENPLRRRIYDTCVRTLRLCMFEHYEDCPWREQALYTLDGRNQMLSGYHAFGEYRFPRSVLELIGHDHRDDGLLHICSPSSSDLVIPFFSLIYIIEMQEYAAYSGDLTLANELYEKMKSILGVFLGRIDDGLVINFHGDHRYWNFYEWRTELQGTLGSPEDKKIDIVLNGTTAIALERLSDIAFNIGKSDDAERFLELREKLLENINAAFRMENGLYRTFKDSDCVTELGCAMAILCGAADKASSEKICNSIVAGELPVPTTLSMRMFKYDALLTCNAEKYKKYILSEIDRVYGYMLNCGATSFWETELGAHDFDSAGSLCHGWSAIPIVYLSEGHTPYRKI